MVNTREWVRELFNLVVSVKKDLNLLKRRVNEQHKCARLAAKASPAQTAVTTKETKAQSDTVIDDESGMYELCNPTCVITVPLKPLDGGENSEVRVEKQLPDPKGNDGLPDTSEQSCQTVNLCAYTNPIKFLYKEGERYECYEDHIRYDSEKYINNDVTRQALEDEIEKDAYKSIFREQDYFEPTDNTLNTAAMDRLLQTLENKKRETNSKKKKKKK